jgi:hypothetical protein
VGRTGAQHLRATALTPQLAMPCSIALYSTEGWLRPVRVVYLVAYRTVLGLRDAVRREGLPLSVREPSCEAQHR